MIEGNKARHVAATKMNDESSRSHAVFTIFFTQVGFFFRLRKGFFGSSGFFILFLTGTIRPGHQTNG
jgi:hypothetical protein